MIEWYKAAFIIGMIILWGSIKLYYPAYKDDNPIEEAVEEVIKEETGIVVDLTPESKEKE